MNYKMNYIKQLNELKDSFKKNYGNEYDYIIIEIDDIIASLNYKYGETLEDLLLAIKNFKSAFERLDFVYTNLVQPVPSQIIN